MSGNTRATSRLKTNGVPSILASRNNVSFNSFVLGYESAGAIMTQNPPCDLDTPDLAELHAELGIGADYGSARQCPAYEEATELVEAGPNLLGRMQRLTPEALAAWRRMATAAAGDGVELLLVSGFRSVTYQADLIRNKLAAGQSIDDILAVNAAPGYSQHHTGAAVDVATPGSRPLTEEFERSEAFAWLTEHAGRFGFSMTYPRANPEGFVYEPWHWAYDGKS